MRGEAGKQLKKSVGGPHDDDDGGGGGSEAYLIFVANATSIFV